MYLGINIYKNTCIHICMYTKNNKKKEAMNFNESKEGKAWREKRKERNDIITL